MPEHELEKLLGGFAADTLTPEERDALFSAALQDQHLFNALADEQALKELLTDPAVRRRLLQALDRHRTQRSTAWLDKFTSPAGLTWAGGVAVGVFAVILGLNIYQDSLRQASETAVLEEGRPSAPATAPSAQAPRREGEIPEPRKGAPIPEPATQDRVAPQRQHSREKPVEGEKRHRLSKEEKAAEAPIAAPPKPANEKATSGDQPARPGSPSSALSLPPMKDIAGAAAGVSARALFYAKGSPGPEASLRDLEKHAQPSQAPERFGLQQTLDQTAPAEYLALRYAFVVRTSEGSEREVTAAEAANHTGPVLLRVETNQQAYLQIWTSTGEALPELLLPSKETGRISLKTAGRQRQEIVVPRERERLTLRLARFPFGPITRQEAVMAGRSSGGQITEHASGTEEQATYVANPDPSAAELAVDIPVGARALP
jgi:hypothetical protein